MSIFNEDGFKTAIGIHQQDERIRNVAQKMPYLAMTVAVLKENESGKL